jgi:hypothetical protein
MPHVVGPIHETMDVGRQLVWDTGYRNDRTVEMNSTADVASLDDVRSGAGQIILCVTWLVLRICVHAALDGLLPATLRAKNLSISSPLR